MEFEREIRHRPTHQYRPEDRNDGLWWQIALGIFVGQLMTGAVVGILALLLGGVAAHEADTQMKAAVDQIQQVSQQTLRPSTPRPSTYRPRRPLSDGERCMGGTRLRRIEHGWAQVKDDPC